MLNFHVLLKPTAKFAFIQGHISILIHIYRRYEYTNKQYMPILHFLAVGEHEKSHSMIFVRPIKFNFLFIVSLYY